MMLALISSLGWPELVIILFVALLIFGRRLPEVGKSLGRGIREFKKAVSSEDETGVKSETDDKDVEKKSETVSAERESEKKDEATVKDDEKAAESA